MAHDFQHYSMDPHMLKGVDKNLRDVFGDDFDSTNPLFEKTMRQKENATKKKMKKVVKKGKESVMPNLGV